MNKDLIFVMSFFCAVFLFGCVAAISEDYKEIEIEKIKAYSACVEVKK